MAAKKPLELDEKKPLDEIKPLEFIKEVLTSNVYDCAKTTPLEKAPYLSEFYSNTIQLKREDLQNSNSFKIRGVYNKIKNIISKHGRFIKLICASTCNHGYAVTIVGKYFGCPVIVIMPKTTSVQNIQMIERMGGQIDLYGDNYDDSLRYAKIFGKDFVFVEPNDHDIIVGNATVALEMVNQIGSKITDIKAIFVPVGDGALIAGVALYMKELYPNIKIIGVGVVDKCSIGMCKQAKKTETKEVDSEPLRICKQYVDEIILVTEDEICGMIKQLYNDIRSIVKCATGVAGMVKYIDREKSVCDNYVVILGGNNLDFQGLQRIVEGANIGDKSEILLRIIMEEKPGSLIKLLRHLDVPLMRESLNISKFHYKFTDEKKTAKLYVGFSMENEKETSAMVTIIREGYTVEEIDNRIIHRYIPCLIGSSEKKIKGEYIFVITLPEKSGALLNFLAATEKMINITMFHYRNNGDTYGNIILGLTLISVTYDDFVNILKKITFITFIDETSNELLS